MRDHPSDDVSAEDIQDDVEVEVRPSGRAEQLGDIPRPELIGACRQQLGPCVLRMPELVATFLDLVFLVEDPVHRSDGAHIRPLVQKGRIDLWRGVIGELVRVEDVRDMVPFRFPKSPWLSSSEGLVTSFPFRATQPVNRASRHSQGVTDRGQPANGCVISNGLYHGLPQL